MRWKRCFGLRCSLSHRYLTRLADMPGCKQGAWNASSEQRPSLGSCHTSEWSRRSSRAGIASQHLRELRNSPPHLHSPLRGHWAGGGRDDSACVVRVQGPGQPRGRQGSHTRLLDALLRKSTDPRTHSCIGEVAPRRPADGRAPAEPAIPRVV